MGMQDVIKKLRLEKGWTQEELGNKVGLQKSAIAKYENGRVSNMKRPVIQKMAEAFNVDPSYLMGFVESDCLEDDDNIEKYLEDPYLKKLILFAGGHIPEEDREKYVDAIINTIETLNSIKK